jgi:membrane protease YdiL (CAAX protease family)
MGTTDRPVAGGSGPVCRCAVASRGGRHHRARSVLLVGGVFPQDWTQPRWYGYPIAFVYVLILGGGQEEPGWRGFALDRLLGRMNGLQASLLLGLVWAAWHIPLFFTRASAQTGLPFLWYVLHTVAVAIIFTWLYRSAARSILLAMLLHAGLNAVAAWLPVTADEGRLILLDSLLVAEWLCAILLLAIYGGELSRARDRTISRVRPPRQVSA